MTTKIAVEGLYKVFGGHPEEALALLKQGLARDEIFARTAQTVAVQDATFDIQEGEIFVLMGLSGSGKSTLLRMFNRLIEPTVGAVRVDGEDITKMSEAALIEMRRRKMAMVFQSFALLPNRSVYENASFGLEVSGVPEDQRRERTLEALDAVGLKANADSMPSELSGGMKQRVGLARALATNPDIMLMDEAFSALDPLIRSEMQDQLLELQKKQTRTVVFVSHDLDEALKIGDRIGIIENGKIAQVAAPTEILRRPANDYVRAFFRGVDVSQVFTVGSIARRNADVEISGADTPARAALDKLTRAGRRLAVVLDDSSRLAGTITVKSLEAAIAKSNGGASVSDAFCADIKPETKGTLLSAALEPLATSGEALPIIDKDGKYAGLVTTSAMLHALRRESDHETRP
jgi:glycine betaine/proline transport system ATP-binding protein